AMEQRTEQREVGYTSVKRAIRLLKVFTPGQPERSIGELARETGLDKSIVTRLMATMAQEGVVVQDPGSRRYQIGPELFAVGNMFVPHLTYARVCQHHLRELAMRCGHSCAIGIVSGRDVLFVAAADGPPIYTVGVAMNVGSRRSLHIGATGKMLLAGMPDSEVRLLLGEGALEVRTPYTPATADILIEDLHEIQRRGYATNREESLLGSGGVAAPIRDKHGATVAALVINFYVHLVSDEEM